MALEKAQSQKPTAAFIGASWLALLIGMGSYLIGLWNASMELNEKGYYLTGLLFGLFAAISVQKAVRDLAAFASDESERERVERKTTPPLPVVSPQQRNG